MSEMNCAEVYILDVPCNADIGYSYYLPERLRGKVGIGMFICVPFGKGNRSMTAVITGLSFLEDVSKLTAVAQILEAGGLSLNEEAMSICRFMKEQTFCTFGEAVRTVIPTGALRGLTAFYQAEKMPEEPLNITAQMVFADIMTATTEGRDSGISGEELVKKYGDETTDLLASLVALGAVTRYYRTLDKTKRVFETVYAVSLKEHSLPAGKKQRAIYDHIALSGEETQSALNEKFGNCQQPLRAMIERGQLSKRSEERYRRAFTAASAAPDDNVLTEEQKKVKESICALIETGEPKAALLYGVTGSGKTRVMKAVVDHVLKKGRSVIVLVPEISLTPQTVGLFSSFFGDQVAILHSGLSIGQRYDEWRRIKEGRAKICIGTRSAVFAPFENLGLIIIDEEQEHTYKSDNSPRYHARDIARFRCGCQKAVMLLSSATPSVESFYKAEKGNYTLCTLTDRYGKAPLPKSIICDMRAEGPAVSSFGEVLLGEIETNLKRKEQTILFVGRRGYNHFASCTLCGQALLCPHCSVSLTYHSYGRYTPLENSLAERARNGYMVCHYCGYRMQVPQNCPSCGSNFLQFNGFGTQMAETELSKLFPEASILRLDADTTSGKDAFDRKLNAFRNREYDIMLGTQMVTKGHDFPDVTLVGVISADTGLYLDDYRAGENTFSLITQVVGRAGRGRLPGRAVIQTYSPDHRTIRLASMQDYQKFYDNEIKLRKSLLFPPFCDIVVIGLSAIEEPELQQAVLQFDKELKSLLKGEYKDLPVNLFGPFEAPLYRVKDRYRMRFVMKTRNCKALRALLHRLNDRFSEKYKQKVLLSVDMNPSSL